MTSYFVDISGMSIDGPSTWKNSVATFAGLPATGNAIGDVRIALDTEIAYIWNGTTWVVLNGGASGITDLVGDVTGTGPGSTATTIGAIQGTSITGTTGSQKVVLSDSPTLTGTANFEQISVSTLAQTPNLTLTGVGGHLQSNQGGSATSGLVRLSGTETIEWPNVFLSENYDGTDYAVKSSHDMQASSFVASTGSSPPASLTFFASYLTSINADISGGSSTGTGLNAVISGNKLDFTGGGFATEKHVLYSTTGNADFTQTFTLRALYEPAYSGTPSTMQVIVCRNKAAFTQNRVMLYHFTDGNLHGTFTDSTGALIADIFFGAWSPVSGTTYEIELDCDFTVGAQRLFVDGVQFGSTYTYTGTFTTDVSQLAVGEWTDNPTNANFKLSNFAVYNTVQHTSNFTSPIFFSNPATTGAVRLSNTDAFNWRNATNNGNLGISLDSNNVFQIESDTTIAGTLLASNFSGSSSGTNTGDVTLAAFGSSPNANGASLSGQVLTLQPADGTNPGGITTGTQTIAGAKTFTGNMVTQALFTNSKTGASGASSVLVSGAPFDGGSPSSTKPLVRFGTSLATDNWNTSGTVLGINPSSAFTGNLLDLQTNSVSVFSVDYAGNVIASDIETTSLMVDLTLTLPNLSASTPLQLNASKEVVSTAIDLSNATQSTGTLAAGRFPALTGDVTTSAGSLATTAAATQNNITSIPNLATVGTITSGTWSGTTIAINKGGTGQTTAGAAFAALSPMTTLGDTIYEDATPTPVRLAGNTTTTKKYLSQTGNGSISAAPSWAQVAFADISGTATSTQVATATFVAPTIQRFTSGSGTYTTPTSPRTPLYLDVQMVGGGGGGGGSGAGLGNGGDGGNTTFGSSLFVANGGQGGKSAGGPANGGTATITGPTGTAVAGSQGGPTGGNIAGGSGGAGGCSFFGGAGAGPLGGANTAGLAGATNSGSGGSGATATAASGAGGGGSGGYVGCKITSPSATYAYAIGAAGAAGAGAQNGGAGGDGFIEVTEYYQ